MKCIYCNIETKNPKYCSLKCQFKHKSKDWLEKQWGPVIDFNYNCNKCNKQIIIKRRQKSKCKYKKYYCSRFCANSRNQRGVANEKRKETFRLKRINSLSKFISDNNKNSTINNELNRNCPQCDNIILYKTLYRCHRANKFNTVCKTCVVKNQKETGQFTQMGRKSSSIQCNSINRRSKNEIYFADLCKKRFKNILTNEPMFNGWDADVIIPELKLAILWNGIWHYEKITEKHSLEQVQNRDQIKLDEILKLGYSYYIIKDMGKFNPSFVEMEFDKFCSFILK